ncbi:rab-GTPase-TBC domain-containing protein [Amylostereum chailletii]|nr:rab-GTPase-TBC domain-containing protein [Amylostereum chailletii]
MAIRRTSPEKARSKPPSSPSNAQPSSKPKLDWNALREQSLAPGGLGPERASLWPRLLNVDVAPCAAEETDLGAHDDERQIRLDTDRSFVLYPVDETMDDRQRRQAELNALIVRLFRRHPGLSYFQGYHDIVTVLFLTLPEEVQLPAAEKMSLHRLRDSMGKTLEPLMGLLRILQQLLRLADSDYAALLEEQAPLPYAALSHLLTLFAHDVPSLPLIQHVFDYLLTRPPIAVVYLAAAVILAHRDEVRLMEREGEEGMIHSVLTGIPDLIDEEADAILALTKTEDVRGGVAVTDEALEEEKAGVNTDDSNTILPSEESNAILPSEEIHIDVEVKEEPLESTIDSIPNPPAEHTPRDEKDESCSSSPDISGTPSPPDFGEPPIPPFLLEQHHHHHLDPASIPLPPSPPLTPPPLPPSPPPTPPRRPTRTTLSLPTLLRQADTLLFLYPPTHASLRLAQTMGPASVIHTWSEDPSSLPPDAEAEAMVVRGTDVVLAWEPEPPSSPSPSASPSASSDDDERHWYGLRRRHPHHPHPSRPHDEKGKGKEKEKKPSRRNKLRKRRRRVFGARAPVERRTLLAGAALVLGVAMAVSVYGMHAHPVRGSGAGGFGGGMGRAVGGLVGAGEKLWAAAVGGFGA